MSPKLPRIGCEKLIQILKRAGFIEQRQRGSHLHLKRITDCKRVTVPVHKGKIVPPATLHAILRDAEITLEEFIKLL